MTIVVSTPPSVEPVTATEAKTFCHVDHSDDDALITSLIVAARQHAETELHRYIITQTLDAYFDEFSECFELPPLQSVTAITYVNLEGTTTTLAADQYTVDAVSKPSRIAPAYGVSWPSTRTQVNAVKVRFVAGYGVAVSVPDCIKSWILLRVRTLYENRYQGPANGGGIQLDPSFIDGLLDPERVHGRI